MHTTSLKFTSGPAISTDTRNVESQRNHMVKRIGLLVNLRVILLMCLSVGFSAQAWAYEIINKTQYAVSGKVNKGILCKVDYYSVAPMTTWSGDRGACLITGISASLTINGAAVSAQSYSSSGTSYGTFFITPTETDFRVWSSHEWQAEVGDQGGKSPGFYIVNKTDWPYSIALSQAGCLYYGVVKSGEVWRRSTGAFWFTINAGISPDGKETRTDWDCVKPVAIIVGGVAIAAITGGYGAFAALPAATAATSIGAAGLAGIATSSTVMVAAGAAGTATATALSISAKQIGELIGKNGQGQLKGQFAGPEWPFRCNQMPVYHLTGGPSLKMVDGKPTMGDFDRPLNIYKQNTCGNSLMAGSVPPQDPNPNYVPLGINSARAAIATAAAPAVQVATTPALTCQQMSDRYNISANVSWGTADGQTQAAWVALRCTTNPTSTSPAPAMSCQQMSDQYAVVANRGWGFSPEDMRRQWVTKTCNTSPSAERVPALCQQMSNQYKIFANQTWGTADTNVQGSWVAMNCNTRPL